MRACASWSGASVCVIAFPWQPCYPPSKMSLWAPWTNWLRHVIPSSQSSNLFPLHSHSCCVYTWLPSSAGEAGRVRLCLDAEMRWFGIPVIRLSNSYGFRCHNNWVEKPYGAEMYIRGIDWWRRFGKNFVQMCQATKQNHLSCSLFHCMLCCGRLAEWGRATPGESCEEHLCASCAGQRQRYKIDCASRYPSLNTYQSTSITKVKLLL